MFLAQGWKDYILLDTGEGEKLENWKGFILRRPDPQAIWGREKKELWGKAHAVYERSSTGGGAWKFNKKLPERWTVSYKGLQFYVRPTGFKHTGLFPEQAANWDFIMKQVRGAGRPVNILNLFAYTGAATLAGIQAGAHVTHVDAAKSMVSWAKENVELNGLAEKPQRHIVDDCLKFVLREQRRGSRYDAILMDPPSYGRGADGQVWKMEDSLFGLVEECAKLLSDDPLFFIINSYTTGLSPSVTKNMLELTVNKAHKGIVEADEIGLPVKDSAVVLPCGSTARWRR
jgi:23S rRNA (cytosine1962-C5)-methyltransferase